MADQETFAGLGSTVYVFRKEDLHEGSYSLIADEHADVKSRVYVSDNPDPKTKNWCQSFSCSGEVEIPEESKCYLFGLDNDDPQHIKADVEFKTEDGKRYFVKDADIEINTCPPLSHKPKPLLWDKLPCDMLTPLCYPLRWEDKHFNRRIYHYQWLKQHNYL